jgi:hypothetical protein
LYRQAAKKAQKSPSDLSLKELATVAQTVVTEEGGKFGQALKKEYDIVMPSDQVRRKVRLKAKELTEGRYAIKADNVKPPVSI